MEKFRLKDSPITYFRTGEDHNETILFLHAAFVNHEMFNDQVAHFEKDYRVITPDILGHGESINGQRSDRMSKMALWLRAILKKEQVSQVHVVGVSLGALLAQDFANKHPDSVASLACFGGYELGSADAEAQKENSLQQMFMMLRAAISIRWFANANMKISAFTHQAQAEFYRMNLQFSRSSFRFFAGLNGLADRSATGARQFPLLIGCGEHDAAHELELIRDWFEREPDSQIRIFENAGHCVNMDVPIQFNSALEAFFRDVRSS